MEPLQERKRKNSESSGVADGPTQQSEECISEPSLKLSKIECYSPEHRWERCIKLNGVFSSGNLEDIPQLISNTDNKGYAKTNEVSGENSDEKSADKVSINSEPVISNSAEKSSINSSGIVSMESEQNNNDNTKPLDPVNTTSNTNDKNVSSNEKLSVESNGNISTESNKLSQEHQQGLAIAEGLEQINQALTEAQKAGKERGTEIRKGIFFFLENGYFDDCFIEKWKNVYEMFMNVFNKHLINLTPICHQIEINSGEEGKFRIIDSLFKHDDGRILLYLWTTVQGDLTDVVGGNFVHKLMCKANVHCYLLEKLWTETNVKISDIFIVRLGPYENEPQIVKVDRITDKATMEKMVEDTWK